MLHFDNYDFLVHRSPLASAVDVLTRLFRLLFFNRVSTHLPTSSTNVKRPFVGYCFLVCGIFGSLGGQLFHNNLVTILQPHLDIFLYILLFCADVLLFDTISKLSLDLLCSPYTITLINRSLFIVRGLLL